MRNFATVTQRARSGGIRSAGAPLLFFLPTQKKGIMPEKKSTFVDSVGQVFDVIDEGVNVQFSLTPITYAGLAGLLILAIVLKKFVS